MITLKYFSLKSSVISLPLSSSEILNILPGVRDSLSRKHTTVHWKHLLYMSTWSFFIPRTFIVAFITVFWRRKQKLLWRIATVKKQALIPNLTVTPAVESCSLIILSWGINASLMPSVTCQHLLCWSIEVQNYIGQCPSQRRYEWSFSLSDKYLHYLH